MRSKVLSVFMALFLSTMAAAQPQLELLAQNNQLAPLSFPQLEDQGCEGVAQVLAAYRDIHRVTSKQVVVYLEGLTETLEEWHWQLKDSEGKKTKFNQGVFEPVTQTAESASQSSDVLYDNSDLLDEKIYSVVEAMPGCAQEQVDPAKRQRLLDLNLLLSDHNTKTRSYEAEVATMLSLLSDVIQAWYEKWQKLEGVDVPIPQGFFDELFETGQDLNRITGYVRDDLKLLQQEYLDIFDEIRKAMESQPLTPARH